MCGISGIITSKKALEDSNLKRMTDIIAHRGPDDKGYYINKNIGFGHRRLSILDIRSIGKQPMFYLDYCIVYNGEIYNYLELKKELEGYGYKFKTNTDTEVILVSYHKWGEECVTHFDGMWSFALHDPKKNIVFCSRDRFGIKPFCYTKTNDNFIFGSEIKQLLIFQQPKANINKVLDFLTFSLIDGHTKETFFKNIFNLPPASNLIYDLNTKQFSIKKYFEITLDKKYRECSKKESVFYYKKLFINSIKVRMRSDVKVGTCLSGGLDSSAVASIASEIYYKQRKEKFNAIHSNSGEKEKQEVFFAKKVVENKPIDLDIIEPKQKDFESSINKVFYTQEEPFGGPSAFMQYFVMKRAKELGIKVMLDGQGGDETLLGYEQYYVMEMVGKNIIQKIKLLLDIRKNSRLSLTYAVIYYFYFGFPRLRIAFKKRVFSKWIKKSMYASYDFKKIKQLIQQDESFQHQKKEINKTNLPSLLRYEDRNSMAHSVEARLPFLNYKTLQAALSFPNEYKIRKGWTKWVLRKAMQEYLPKIVIWRKNKFGFEAPTKSWIKSYLKEMQETVNNSKILKEICHKMPQLKEIKDDKIKWSFYSIAKWEEVYKVNID